MKKDYLIIDRAKWRTGANSLIKTGVGQTQLLNKEGYMCCLGFRCHQMGIPEKDLLGMGSPGSIITDWDIPDLINSRGNTPFTAEAVRINDDSSITPEEREKEITEHFATIGVTVEFKGIYPKK